MVEPQPDEFPFHRQVPPGDDRPRHVCRDCGWIHYENPKVVVGVVPIWEGRVLLCRREIEPRRGFWTIPAGFLEENESVEEGALREAQEEVTIEPRIDALLAVYSIPRISQVQIIYRGVLPSPAYEPGPETAEASLFAWEDVPWSDLAFPSVRWALNHYRETREQRVFPPFGNPPGETGRMPEEE